MTDFGKRVGDMSKSTYDTDKDDVVDDSEKLDGSSKAEVQNHTPKSHEHVEADITDLDHDAQKIKGVIINAAAIADQKVLAYDSGTDRIVYITPAPSGAVIKSIQYGSIEIPGEVKVNTATINSVDTTKAVILWLGNSGTGDLDGNLSDLCCSVALTDATTVTATKIGETDPSTVNFVVIEFESGVESVQQGVVNLGLAVGTATINSVDVDKAIVLPNGHTNPGGGSGAWNFLPRLTLTNATTVTATRALATGTVYVGFSVLEFS